MKTKDIDIEFYEELASVARLLRMRDVVVD
jgi:hypothetical protein